MAQSCPERHGTYFTQVVALCQSNYGQLTKFKNFNAESWNVAVLNNGTTNTVVRVCYLNKPCFIKHSTPDTSFIGIAFHFM